jgi:methyl-accepting chemotaxis protein
VNSLVTISQAGGHQSVDGLSTVETCAARTETIFLAAGDHLQSALDVLNRLKALFPRLENGLGADAGLEFAQASMTLQQAATSSKQGLGDFIARTEDLQTAARSVSRDISDLDRVVRTIMTLAVTARLIGHSMSPPQPKVASFVENLSVMAGEAERILVDVKETIADIRTETAELSETVELLRKILVQDILTVVAQLTGAAEKVQAGRAEFARTNQTLSDRMADTFSGVSRLIISLQAGDSFRQRLNRVIAMQDCVADMPSASATAAALDLLEQLLTSARTQATQDVSTAVATLHELEGAAHFAIQVAQRFYLGAGVEGMGRSDLANHGIALKAHLADFETQLRVLEARSHSVLHRLQYILDQERGLRAIGQKVRLAGVNAIVICTQLGHKGNALREVAQWLRGMTDEADLIIGQLQLSLGNARAISDDLGTTSVDVLQTGSARIFEQGADVQRRISKVHSLIGIATKETRQAGKSLPASISAAIVLLTDFNRLLGHLEGVLAVSRAKRSTLPDPILPFPTGSAEEAVFDALRSDYTMEAERLIHDRMLSRANEATSENSHAQTVDMSGLEDILF